MKLYRTFGALHYKGGMYAPFIDSKWTKSKSEAMKFFDSVALADFRKADSDALSNAQADQIPTKWEGVSEETFFLWIELVEVDIDRGYIPANDMVLEIADYNQNELAERGLWLNGRKMDNKTLKKILNGAELETTI